MLHNAGVDNAAFFFGNVSSLDYDIVALSYYPIWHGKDLAVVQSTQTRWAHSLIKTL